MNYCGNPVQELASVLADARYVTFRQVEYKNRNWEEWKKLSKEEQNERILDHREYEGNLSVTMHRFLNNEEITVAYMFPQTWGSTALGFGGIGGAAMTTAYTIIVQNDQTDQYAVYFGGRHAYSVDRPNGKFFDDVTSQRMKSVSECGVYRD
jgi:hypothetical protein